MISDFFSTIQCCFLFNLFKAKTSKAVKKVIEPTYLACQHHLYMTIGINVAVKPKKRTSPVAVIGLGGGGLCSFIRHILG